MSLRGATLSAVAQRAKAEATKESKIVIPTPRNCEAARKVQSGLPTEAAKQRRMVPLAGIEPALLAELDFGSTASTSSATGAFRAQPEDWVAKPADYTGRALLVNPRVFIPTLQCDRASPRQRRPRGIGRVDTGDGRDVGHSRKPLACA